MYAKLSDSYQWNQLNSSGALGNKIQDLIQNGQHVGLDRIQSAVLKLRNRIKSPILSQIFETIADGELTMIYAPGIKVPTYLPFVLIQSGPNSCKGFVFLNNLDASESDVNNLGQSEIFLNERKLKVSLESCYIAMMIQRAGNSPKLRNTTLLRCGSQIYSSMITECINRKHAIKLDLNVYNALLYLTSKYYVGTMMGCRKGMDEEVLENYCLYNCKQADLISIKTITQDFQDSDFDNIANFINKLKDVPEFNKRLGKLTVSNFLESYINMYDASMLLALENFNYFLYNILAVNESTYTNNYQVLKNIVNDNGKKIYADLVVSVCGK